MITDVRFVLNRHGRWYVIVDGVRLRGTYPTKREAAGALVDAWRTVP